MAYDEGLADRIREVLARERGVGEIKMFGGLCFTVDGHMAAGIVGEELMARIGPDGWDKALARPGAREMNFTGKSMKGFVFVEPSGIKTQKMLASWIDPAVTFVRTLPPKKPKAKAAKKRVPKR